MTVFASSNALTLAMIEESVYGTVPGSGAMKYMPYTGESLKFSKETTSSGLIDQSRQVKDVIATGHEVSGGFDFELAARTYDELFEGALWKRWGTATDVTITASVVAATKTITASAGTPFSNVVAGQFIKFSGMDESANNGVFKVASKTSSLIIVLESTYALADEAATADVSVKGCMIRNPTTAQAASGSVALSYYIEKALNDLATVHRFSYSGLMVNSFSLSAQASSPITGSFDFMGKDSTSYSTGTKSPSAITTITGTDVFNAISHLGGIRVDGALMNTAGVYFQGLDFSIANALRGIKAVGEMGNVGVSPGDIGATGSMNPYFANDTMYAKFLAGTKFALSYELIDADGEGYVFSFPNVIISDTGMNSGGKDQDMVENISWTALVDPTLGVSVQIDRFYADYDLAPDAPTVYTG